jgi:ADP-ribose pyrophosphatase YjhB (NUDIX family)
MAAPGWLTQDEYAHVRALVPVACVDLVPWRAGPDGIEVGLITRVAPSGDPAYAMIGGRVLRDETLAAALDRHVRETLGEGVAIGAVDTERPLGVYEYFPDGRDGLLDPDKHAIAMTYAAELSGTPHPAGEASAFAWFPGASLPAEAEFGFGHGRVVREVLARLSSR